MRMRMVKKHANIRICECEYSDHHYSIPTEAPHRDLDLMKRLIKYGEVNAKISRVTSNKVRNHLWYLSEELVALSFFDCKVQPSEMKMVLALNEECHDEYVKRHIQI